MRPVSKRARQEAQCPDLQLCGILRPASKAASRIDCSAPTRRTLPCGAMRTSNVSLIGRYDTPARKRVLGRDSGILPAMRIEFTKMHGAGNDFIVLDAPDGAGVPTAEQLRHLAQRHTGIGFDQALVLEKARKPGTAAFYRIFNADGDEVEQCGNGARCIAALLAGRDASAPKEMTLDSAGGLVHARIKGPHLVALDMGIPSFDPASLPFAAKTAAKLYRLEIAAE